MRGAILVVSGPSGCGKSSLVNEVLKNDDNVYFSISTTTRDIRDGEVDGVNYHYIKEKEFKKEIDNGMFLEWAEVHGNYYGTSLRAVNDALSEGKLVIFDIDVQGHSSIRNIFNDITTSIFITTPSSDALRDRLTRRGTDSNKTIESRLVNSKEEMERLDEYDFFLINDKLEDSHLKFSSVVDVARLKIDKKSKDRFINEWYNRTL